jgi:HAE1 family hydrophobic/amphiphilic exporter-1
MNISELFIKRPVMTTLLMLWLVLMSSFSYKFLPVSALPKIDFPVIQVSAKLAGASPEVMAKAVSLPLEQKFSAIPGLENMTSINAQGITKLTLEFGLNVDLNSAAQDVSTAISSAQSSLPTTMTTTPTFKKVNPSEQPIIILAMSSDSMPIWQLNNTAEDYVVNRLSMLADVAQVDIVGQQRYAVRVNVKPEMVKNRGIGLDTIANNIVQANINGSSGVLQGMNQSFMLFPNSQLKNAKEFSEILLNKQNNLRLKDVATVLDDVDNIYSSAWFNGERCIIITISRQPGSNAIAVADKVKKVLPEIRKQLPQNLDLDIIVDRTISIRDSVKEIQLTAIMTIVLVVLVIFFFLRNVSTTIIPALSLPISLVITFSAMYFLGYSLNNLTLLALTLATGFIIDDAIVVLENITVYRERGMSAYEAALSGSKEISFTVISMTLSLIAAFIPVLFMPGIIGRLLHEFAVTITIVILASGFVSLSMIPMLSQYLKDEHKESKGIILDWFNNFYEKMAKAYEISLIKVFEFKKHIIAFVLGIFFLNVLLYVFIPKGFFPNEDTGLIYGVAEVLPDTSFESMVAIEGNLIEILKNDPNIDNFNCSIGMSSTTIASNEGRFFIKLKDIGKRDSIDKVMQKLRKKFAEQPNLKISMQAVQNLRVGASLSKSQFQYTLQSQDLGALSEFSLKMEANLSKLPGFVDVVSDLKMNSLQADIKIDRNLATRFGLSVKAITDALAYAYADSQVSTIYTESNTYPVILGLEKQESKNLSDLSQLYVTSDSGSLVPLSAVASVERKNGPLTVNHLNRLAAATISFNLKSGVSLSQAIALIKTAEQELKIPSNVTSTFQGTAQAFQQSQGGQLILILATIFTIYIILGVLYESYRHPITIITGLPSAGLGALIFLWLFRYDLDVIAIIGIVLLIGIVKKNAIMMVDYAIVKQREHNLSAQEAIIEACKRRFRPIMMTTFAAIIGALPIALMNGSGSELRKPRGICIIGGVLLSQWLTLYITPLFFVWIDTRKRIFNKVL